MLMIKIVRNYLHWLNRATFHMVEREKGCWRHPLCGWTSGGILSFFACLLMDGLLFRPKSVHECVSNHC